MGGGTHGRDALGGTKGAFGAHTGGELRARGGRIGGGATEGGFGDIYRGGAAWVVTYRGVEEQSLGGGEGANLQGGTCLGGGGVHIVGGGIWGGYLGGFWGPKGMLREQQAPS